MVRGTQINDVLSGKSAISQIFRVIDEQSQATFDENFNRVVFYSWTGGNGALSPAVPNAGIGEPKAFTGLVGTHHRPSDDLSTFGTSSKLRIARLFSPRSASSIPHPGKRYA